jgi:hypothetical protein
MIHGLPRQARDKREQSWTNVSRAHQRGAFFLQVARKVTAAGGKAYVFHWDYKGCSGAPETKTPRPSTVLSAVFWLKNKNDQFAKTGSGQN